MGYYGKKKITFGELLNTLKKGTRKGNWRKLTWMQRILYRTAMEYTRPKKKEEIVDGKVMKIERKGRNIVNTMLVKKLSTLLEKLQETPGMRIFERGRKRADKILQNGEANGLFAWVPRLKDWLKDPSYIFWLGTVREETEKGYILT